MGWAWFGVKSAGSQVQVGSATGRVVRIRGGEIFRSSAPEEGRLQSGVGQIHKHGPRSGHRHSVDSGLAASTATPSDVSSSRVEHCSNRVTTSHYTAWSFLPKNFVEQFSKPSNAYFLFIMILQIIPSISVTDGKPTIAIPLTIVFFVNAIKDAIEDWRRHQSDQSENEQLTTIIQPVLLTAEEHEHEHGHEQQTPGERHEQQTSRTRANEEMILTEDGRAVRLRYEKEPDVKALMETTDNQIKKDEAQLLKLDAMNHPSEPQLPQLSEVFAFPTRGRSLRSHSGLNSLKRADTRAGTRADILARSHTPTRAHTAALAHAHTMVLSRTDSPARRPGASASRRASSAETLHAFRSSDVVLANPDAVAPTFSPSEMQSTASLAALGSLAGTPSPSPLASGSFSEAGSASGSACNPSGGRTTDLRARGGAAEQIPDLEIEPRSHSKSKAQFEAIEYEEDEDEGEGEGELDDDSTSPSQSSASEDEMEKDLLLEDFVMRKEMRSVVSVSMDDESKITRVLKTRWCDLQVGDLILIRNDDTVPADCLIIATADALTNESGAQRTQPQSAIVFVETSSLDGESALKSKRSLPFLQTILANANEFQTWLRAAALDLVVAVGPPHAALGNFAATVQVTSSLVPAKLWRLAKDGQDIRASDPLASLAITPVSSVEGTVAQSKVLDSTSELLGATADNLLLRSTKVRYVPWVVALVLFTGDETKTRLNARKAVKKESNVERKTHKLVLSILLFCLLLCGVAASVHIALGRTPRWRRLTYLDLFESGTSVGKWFKVFFTWIVICSTLIPISLVVCMGLIRAMQAWHMNQDRYMYSKALDQHCVVRTSDLNENLGQVSYILTDKTGTLTQNLMTLTKLAIGPLVYANDHESHEAVNGPESLGLSKVITPHVRLNNHRLAAAVISPPSSTRGPDSSPFASSNDRLNACLMLLHLATNHGLLTTKESQDSVDEDSNEVLEYIASSPDEEASVYGAHHFGFSFRNNVNGVIVVRILGKIYRIKIVHTEAFTSERKRSEILVALPPDLKAFLYGDDKEDGDHDNDDLPTTGPATGSAKESGTGTASGSVSESSSESSFMFFVKGADTTVVPMFKQKEDRDFADAHVRSFGEVCLRTLCLGNALIKADDPLMAEVSKKLREAERTTDFDTRNAKFEQAFTILEQKSDLRFQGVTGVEDSLARNVPQTIHNLMKGGIKVWVLTGDKLEPALNISQSCKLVPLDAHKIFVKNDIFFPGQSDEEGGHGIEKERGFGDDYLMGLGAAEKEELFTRGLQHVRDVLATLQSYDNGSRSLETADGRTVTTRSNSFSARRRSERGGGRGRERDRGREKEKAICTFWDGKLVGELMASGEGVQRLIFEICDCCASCVFYRVAPQDKGSVARMLRTFAPGSVCLAIGDGANDCNMIQAANVGVGIKGREGMQAFSACDYGIGEFRFLETLLLVHGRWNYRRMSKIVLQTFYKNMVFVLPMWYLGTISLFSGQKAFSEAIHQTYNVCLTALPLLAFGVWDQDVDRKLSLKFPQLYRAGIDNVHLNTRAIALWLILGVWHSVVAFGLPFFALTGRSITATVGPPVPNDFSVVSHAMAFLIILIVNFKIILESMCPNWITLLSVLLSVGFWLFVITIESNWVQWAPLSTGVVLRLFLMPTFYALIIAALIISLSSDIILQIFQRSFRPELHHLMQFLMRFHEQESRTRRALILEAIKEGGPQLLRALEPTKYHVSDTSAFGSSSKSRSLSSTIGRSTMPGTPTARDRSSSRMALGRRSRASVRRMETAGRAQPVSRHGQIHTDPLEVTPEDEVDEGIRDALEHHQRFH